MKTLKLSNNELQDWIASWQEQHTIFAPQLGADASKPQYHDWAELAGNDIPEPPVGPVKNSIKRFFQPQPQTLGTFSADQRDDKAFIIAETLPDSSKKTIILGARPCDARGVLLANQILATDPYYQALRDKNIVVGMTCEEQLPTCFCHETGASPLLFIGMDIALSKSDDGWLAEIVTKRGEELMGRGEEASDDEVAALKARRDAISQSSPAHGFKEQSRQQMYDHDSWQALADRCISCGSCTYLCPTCSCFDIQDETLGSKGRRIRNWDSCMTALFTAHTSGHNPRGDKLSRVRQRFMHKLKYYPDDYGPLYCVGCGRCVRDCPTNIDIREVINDLQA